MKENDKSILVIDDDVDICLLLERFFKRKGFSVSTVYNGKEGFKLLDNQHFDLVLTDYRLPDIDGVEVLAHIKSTYPDLPVIIITGYSDVKQAVSLIQQGAFEYVTKPIFPEEILMHVNNALKSENKTTKSFVNEAGRQENKVVSKSSKKSIPEFVIGLSEEAKETERLIKLVAPTEMTVLILGESGTGKELAARRIHELSGRNKGPFVAVDCGAIPQELAASELFGHVKGAFTGAITNKEGYFEQANGGTLFLDELGNLSYDNQVKLLRVLQERVYKPVGGTKEFPIDVRVVVATNENLKTAIQKGDFREDIYYRINEFSISLTPLRERKEDFEVFINFFLGQANQDLGKKVKGISEEALKVFLGYQWPGNLRELKNVIRRCTLLTQKNKIERTVLPEDLFTNIVSDEHRELSTLNLKEVVEHAEKKTIVKALALANNNKSKCADLLGVDRKTLYNKLNLYDLL